MKSLGLIPPERLANIPENRWQEHEFCFHIHDLMVSMLIDMERRKAGFISFQLESEEEVSLLHQTDHILDFLAQSGRSDLERRAIVNHTSVALFADVSHFLHGALVALEKRKFTVAYTLLRKPLKEALLLAARMVADEETFFDELKSNSANALDISSAKPDEKRQIIDSAIKVMRMGHLFGAQALYQTIYDHENEHGFARLFDKATHLITKNKKIRTEDYNINFIFKNPIDDDVYEDYFHLAYAMLFLHFLQIELFFRAEYKLPKYRNWLMFTTIGAFETIFKKGRSPIVSQTNSMFAEFMECPACTAPIRLKKRDAPIFFLTETLSCSSCGRSHQFPLQWFLAKFDSDLFHDGDPSAEAASE